MPGLREYLSHRPNRVMYITLKFTHPAFEQVRLVADQMFQKTLGGEVYSPCRMEVSESEQSDSPIVQCAVKLSRVAQDIKQGLKGWTGAQRMIPITAVYQKWDSIDMTTAVSTWSLFVRDISMDENDVTATIALKNPMVNNVGKPYNTTDFPGLINI
ncbi:Domain of uncharacterised function (DUF1833) [Yersinia aldovae]|uniref:DUF1833 family protein n=1 Tax=Yersinia aldovae TaxID=29483 RepID=UPI0005E696D5|nr:DUF1833 family protein [Yersinia aldovae]CNJ19052.1 Domain of uncharacterised function (DUF1833) [Yersinia aldovae]